MLRAAQSGERVQDLNGIHCQADWPDSHVKRLENYSWKACSRGMRYRLIVFKFLEVPEGLQKTHQTNVKCANCARRSGPTGSTTKLRGLVSPRALCVP